MSRIHAKKNFGERFASIKLQSLFSFCQSRKCICSFFCSGFVSAWVVSFSPTDKCCMCFKYTLAIVTFNYFMETTMTMRREGARKLSNISLSFYSASLCTFASIAFNYPFNPKIRKMRNFGVTAQFCIRSHFFDEELYGLHIKSRLTLFWTELLEKAWR